MQRIGATLFAVDSHDDAVRKSSTPILDPVNGLNSHVVVRDGGASITVNAGVPPVLLGAVLPPPPPKPNADAEGRNVYVWKLSPPLVDEQTIQREFGAAFGPVERVYMFEPRTKNCANVTFSSAASANLAVSTGTYASAKMKLSLPKEMPNHAPTPFTVSSGVVCFEVTIGAPRSVIVGWGVGNAKAFDGTNALGFDCLNGTLLAGAEPKPFGERCGVGDVVSVVVDVKAKRLVLAKNGVVLGQHVPLSKGMLEAVNAKSDRRKQVGLRPFVLLGPGAHVEVAREILTFRALASGQSKGARAVAGPLLSLRDSTSAGSDTRITLHLRDLPPDWDEVEIKAWATSCGPVEFVAIFRGTSGAGSGTYGDWSLKNEQEFVVSVDGVLSQSLRQDEREMLTSLEPTREGRGGMSVQLSRVEGGTFFGLMESAAGLVRGERMHGQPLRVEGRTVEHFNVPTDLYKCRRAAIEATVATAKNAGVLVQSKVRGSSYHLTLEVRFEGGGLGRTLNHALITALDELSISCRAVAYSHANSLAALFTRKGFEAMAKVQAEERSMHGNEENAGSGDGGEGGAVEQVPHPSPGYVAWDRQAQKVQLYGRPETVAYLKGRLDTFVEAARDTPVHELFVAKAKMPLARRLCNDLLRLEGVFGAAPSSVNRLRLQATPEALVAACDLLRGKGVPLLDVPEASGKQQVTPTDRCSICHDVADDARLVVSCGHAFCVECITPLWRQRDEIPFSCCWAPPKAAPVPASSNRAQNAVLPYGGVLQDAMKAGDRAAIRAIMAARNNKPVAPPPPEAQGGGNEELVQPNCGTPIVWRDIECHLGAEDLQNLQLAAWDVFLQRPETGLRPCFASGCNQVLRARPSTVQCSDAHGLKVEICVACSTVAKEHVAVSGGMHAKIHGTEHLKCPFAAPTPGAAVEAARASAAAAALATASSAASPETPGVECDTQVRCPVVASSRPLHHACDLCNAEHCLACSAREDAAVRAHGSEKPCRNSASQQRSRNSTSQQRKREVEELLVDKCPRCAKFVHFGVDGCFALRCQCGCVICAYCWKNCGSNDPHPHVRNCSLTGAPKDKRGLFPSNPIDIYAQAQQERRRTRVSKYFALLPDNATRRETAQACHRAFADFGFDIRVIGGPW